MPEATPTALRLILMSLVTKAADSSRQNTNTLLIVTKILPVFLHATKENNDKNRRYVVLNATIVCVCSGLESLSGAV